jgi:hypothetical protein
MRERLNALLPRGRAALALTIVFVLVTRLLLGRWFGGTGDHAGYLLLWLMTEDGVNPYAQSEIMAWPPLWWMLVGLWASLYQELLSALPNLREMLPRFYFLKLLYFAFEVGVAAAITWHLRESSFPPGTSKRSTPRVMAAFLAIPATWVITSLHGNFDPLPTLLAFVAFVACAETRSDTSAAIGALCLGLAIMARTFPVFLAMPLLIAITRQRSWKAGLWCGALVCLPTVVSLYPLYLLTPDRIQQLVFGYRGQGAGWWGLSGIGRLFAPEAVTQALFRFQFVVFYPLLLSLMSWLGYRLWVRKSSVYDVGMLSTIAFFCLAPTLSNQNFYFLLPWAFCAAAYRGSTAAKVFLWILSLDLLLIYVVIPLNLDQPSWFQWTYDFNAEIFFWNIAELRNELSPVNPKSTPEVLVRGLGWMATYLKREALEWNPFIQNVLRTPVWVALWAWFIAELKSLFAPQKLGAYGDTNSLGSGGDA